MKPLETERLILREWCHKLAKELITSSDLKNIYLLADMGMTEKDWWLS